MALMYFIKTYFASLAYKHHRSGPIGDHLYSIPLIKAYQVPHIINQCISLLFSGSSLFSKYLKMGFLQLSSGFYRFRLWILIGSSFSILGLSQYPKGSPYLLLLDSGQLYWLIGLSCCSVFMVFGATEILKISWWPPRPYCDTFLFFLP